MSDSEYAEFDDGFPLRDDPRFQDWRSQVVALLPASAVKIRVAAADGPDGRRMRDVQLVTAPLPIREVKDNVSKIADRVVLLSEIEGVHVGFCISFLGPKESDPMFLQEVAVVPGMQGRGIGIALVRAAAEREPRRNIALATQDDNEGAQALNKKFATSIGATMHKVNLGTYRPSDLGIQLGKGYRAWVVQRPSGEP